MVPGTSTPRTSAITGTTIMLTRLASRVAGPSTMGTPDITTTATPEANEPNGPLRAISPAAADPPRHESRAAAALPRARHRECHRPGAGDRHRFGPEPAALRRRRGGGRRHRHLAGVAGH